MSCRARWRGDDGIPAVASPGPAAIQGGAVAAVRGGGRGGWFTICEVVTLCCRDEMHFAGCGGDAERDLPGWDGGVAVDGNGRSVGIVGADMEPPTSDTDTGGAGGGVRVPSLGAPDACENRRRDADEPWLVRPLAAELHGIVSSRLPPLTRTVSGSHHGVDCSGAGGTTTGAVPIDADGVVGSVRAETARSNAAPAASARSLANSITRSLLVCWPSSPSITRSLLA